MRISADQIRKIIENSNDFKGCFDCEYYYLERVSNYSGKNHDWGTDPYDSPTLYISTRLKNKDYFSIRWGKGDYDFSDEIDFKKLSKSQKDILIEMIEKIKDYKDPYEREFKTKKLGVFNNNLYKKNIPVYYNQEEDEVLVKANYEHWLWKQEEWEHYKKYSKSVSKEYQELIDKCYEFANNIIDNPDALLIENSLFVNRKIIDKCLNKNLRYNIGKYYGREAIPFTLMVLVFPSLFLGAGIGLLFPILMKIAPVLVLFTPLVLFSIPVLKALPKWEDYADTGLVEYGLGYIEYEENQAMLNRFGITKEKLIEYIEKTSEDKNKESYEEVVIPKEEPQENFAKETKDYKVITLGTQDRDLKNMINTLNEEIEKALKEGRIKSNDIILNKYKDELNNSIKDYNQLKDSDKEIVKENIELLTEKIRLKGVNNLDDLSISVKTLNKILKE